MRFDPGPPEEMDRGPTEAPEDAGEVLEKKPKAKATKKVEKKRRIKAASPEKPLVRPVALGRAREGIRRERKPVVGGPHYAEWLEEQKLEAMLQRLAEGTRLGYESGWRQWTSFRRLQNKGPVLESRDRAERTTDEDALITFSVYLARVLGRTEGTIRQKLFAIRYAHLVMGYADPLLHRAKLWVTLAGLHRWQGPRGRKKPITTKMLLWLQQHISTSSYSKGGQATLWFGLMLGFFFMLRASEYLLQERSWSEGRVLRGDDISLRHQNKEIADVTKASELVIHIRGSKTDQYNVGTTRNQFATGVSLCPVRAYAEIFRQRPHRLRGSEAHLPVMRWEDGSSISRAAIQSLLELSAVAMGQDPSEVGSHSLRIGGASAMYHSVPDLQAVRRFGRWASDAFHVYLWESHEQMQGIAKNMALDKSELAAPKEAWRRCLSAEE